MRRPALTALTLSAVLALAACGANDSPVPADQAAADQAATTAPAEDQVLATAALTDPSGASRGTVEFHEQDSVLRVSVVANDLDPGFHGLHLHGIGVCEPNSASPDDPQDVGDFLSAGGHLGEGDHPDHAGDLPALLVHADGTASMTFTTDRVSAETLLDADGTAVIVHADPDNYAHIPDRYSPAADEDTLGTGDAGSRAACGVVEPA